MLNPLARPCPSNRIGPTAPVLGPIRPLDRQSTSYLAVGGVRCEGVDNSPFSQLQARVLASRPSCSRPPATQCQRSFLVPEVVGLSVVRDVIAPGQTWVRGEGMKFEVVMFDAGGWRVVIVEGQGADEILVISAHEMRRTCWQTVGRSHSTASEP